MQIGYLQWRRDNGFDNDRTPVLQNLDGFRNEDALLEPHFGRKARNLKEARADEHTADTSLKFYTERAWPKCDVIVGNPPTPTRQVRRRTDLAGSPFLGAPLQPLGDFSGSNKVDLTQIYLHSRQFANANRRFPRHVLVWVGDI